MDERQYALLSGVETDERGQPEAFSSVLDAIVSGHAGQSLVTENARRAHYHDGVLVWTPVNSSRYYYSPIAGEFNNETFLFISPRLISLLQIYC